MGRFDTGNRQVTGDRVAVEAPAEQAADGRPLVGRVGGRVQSHDSQRTAGRAPLDHIALALAPRRLADREEREQPRALQVLSADLLYPPGVAEPETAEPGDLLQGRGSPP